jgi:hypothetical protein
MREWTWAEVKNALNEKATEPQTRQKDGRTDNIKKTMEEH